MTNFFPGGTVDVAKPGATETDKKPDPSISLGPPSSTPSPSEDHRRMVALSFVHQIGQCRLALRYSMIGWTGTLDQDKIPSALSNAHSITQLNNRMDALERSLRPFLARGHDDDGGGQALGAEHARLVGQVRRRLLEVAPGVKSTRPIAPVLDWVEAGARDAGLLPPEDRRGWAWSWAHGGWFRWEDGERKWVSARGRGLRVDYLM